METCPRCRYDVEADAAYVTLVEHIEPAEAVRTVPVEALPGVLLDLDGDGRLLGLEVLSASRRLRPELLGNGRDVVIRRWAPADAADTVEVFQQAIRQTAAQYYDAEQIRTWARDDVDMEQWCAKREQAWTVVAVVDGRVVGFCDLTREGLLDMLFVHPDVGGRGVARALVTTVLDHARLIGLHRVDTHASRAARPVFERLGFVVDADRDPHLVRGVNIPNHDMHVDLIPAVPTVDA